MTGCAGFIGSHLTESLLHDGHEVVGVDCFNNNYGRSQKLRHLARASDWDSFSFIPVDLARGDVDDLVSDAEVVFHLAAEPGVRPSWGSRFEQYLRNNVLATQNLLDATHRHHGTRRFVYASSSSIYGEVTALPTGEDVTPAPHSPYGVTKLAGEHTCMLYAANHGVDAVSLRYFSVYGPRQRPDMAFRRFCTAIIEGEPVQILGDGHQTRDFTFVDDVVAATREAGVRPNLGGTAINVGGGSPTSLTDALEMIRSFASDSVQVHYAPVSSGDVRHTGADISRARDLLGYAPSTPIEVGLASEWEWVRADRDMAMRGRRRSVQREPNI